MRDNEIEQVSGEYISAVPDLAESRRNGADEVCAIVPIAAAAEEDEEADKRRLPFLMAGIGASAGGVEAYIKLFEQLPPDTGMAFVVILHLSPDLKSHLTEILARHSSMPVETIGNGMEPRPDRIYVLPANARVRLANGVFHLDSRNTETAPRPIDDFFRSLAYAQKNRAVGVVLSGMDGDGALGLKAIKGEGGITIVQSPESARFPEMPLSSMAGDHVDMVLPPRAIAGRLAQLARQFSNPELRTLDEGTHPPDDHFGKILALMKGVSGIDFRLYKPNTIRRRIVRRMLLQHIDTLPGYEAFLTTNSRELRDLQQDALINVTRFFRDPEVFDTLKTIALPRIFDNRDAGQQIRVWVAGCSSGEEVYSLAMCMLEYLTGKPEEPAIQIFGTDASEQNIQKARAGVYPEAIAAEVSPERLRRFFFKTDKGYHVVKRVRDLCIFARQNLCQDPPFSRMDLISCRNVLIYFGSTLQRQVIQTFHYSLRQDGLLLLGSSEAIREFTDLFALLDRKSKLFGKIGSSATRPFPERMPALFAPDLLGNTVPGERAEDWGDIDLQRAMDRIVLARYGPPAVVINERLEILQSRGNTSPFFEMPQGTATFHLSRMARPEIASQLMDVVQQAIETDTSAQLELVRVRDSDRRLQITIEVLPIHTVNVRPRCYLVLFIAAKQVGATDAELEAFAQRTTDEKSRIVGNLRQDLASTRLYLQSLLEERDARNQELVSANEEIQSSNEELQSANEELETTKEELQSSNEELQTVNDELQNRNQVLIQASNDLSNLLNSVNLPVLMLSNELTIRHFTPPAQRWMNVRSSDIGRPFGEIRMNIEMDTLEPLLRDVLDTLNAREIEVKDRNGRWHLLRVRPYRTVDNRIEGLVIVLVDIDQLRRSQQESLEARDFARSVLECVPLPLVVVDLDYRIRTVNEAFCRLAHTPPADLDKRSLPDLAASLWGPDQSLRSHLADLRTATDDRKTFEFVQETSGEHARVLRIRGGVLHPDGEFFLLVTVEDITAHKQIERLLKEKGERLAMEVESATLELGRSREELRALTRSLFTSQEEERRRVARELHDDVSQRLALIEIHGEQTEREMEDNPELAQQKLRELRAKIGELSRDVRGISHRLHPATIEDLGLASALRSLTEEFRTRERMITTFAHQDIPENIPTGVAIGLYRIAQEALRNVAKHAGQTHVKVSLRGGANHLVLQVTDSGIGFDMEGGRSGLGLISMQERARHLNATFGIESMLGEGTKVTVDVPLDGSSDIGRGGGGNSECHNTILS